MELHLPAKGEESRFLVQKEGEKTGTTSPGPFHAQANKRRGHTRGPQCSFPLEIEWKKKTDCGLLVKKKRITERYVLTRTKIYI